MNRLTGDAGPMPDSPRSRRFAVLIDADNTSPRIAAGLFEEIARFGEALETDDPAVRVQELGLLGGFERLRDLGVPKKDLDALGQAASKRGGAKANPRPASAAEVAELMRSVW